MREKYNDSRALNETRGQQGGGVRRAIWRRLWQLIVKYVFRIFSTCSSMHRHCHLCCLRCCHFCCGRRFARAWATDNKLYEWPTIRQDVATTTTTTSCLERAPSRVRTRCTGRNLAQGVSLSYRTCNFHFQDKHVFLFVPLIINSFSGSTTSRNMCLTKLYTMLY